MNELILEIYPQQPFSFLSTLYAHGWAELEPFRIDTESQTLSYSLTLSTARNVVLQIGHVRDIAITVKSNINLSESERQKIELLIRRMFRTEENFSEFYNMAARHQDFNWIVEKKAGRLMRAGSVWEDMVKMLCTTNCSWHLTRIMTSNLVQIAGNGTHFPEAHEILTFSESRLRKEIKLGYRAPYLLQMSENVVDGIIYPEKWENWNGATYDLFKEIRKIKGLGDYAVSNILKLLGRYDFLGIDSWGRKSFAARYNKGKMVADEQIKAKYLKFGQWSGLFYWMDLTREIYTIRNESYGDHMEEQTVKIFTLEREHEYLIPLIDDVFKKNDIEYHVRSKYDRAYDGVFISQKGIGDLYVFRQDREKAQKILEDILRSEPGQDLA